MVGDSLEYDIFGGYIVGWDILFVCSGLYIDDFVEVGIDEILVWFCGVKFCVVLIYFIEVFK